MTATSTEPKTHSNGADTAPATIDDRVTALEQTVAKIAAVVAQLMAQQVQPQVQAAILAQLIGQQPPPVKAET